MAFHEIQAERRKIRLNMYYISSDKSKSLPLSAICVASLFFQSYWPCKTFLSLLSQSKWKSLKISLLKKVFRSLREFPFGIVLFLRKRNPNLHIKKRFYWLLHWKVKLTYVSPISRKSTWAQNKKTTSSLFIDLDFIGQRKFPVCCLLHIMQESCTL